MRQIKANRASKELLKDSKPDRLFYCLSGAWVTCILGLREDVGADYQTIYAQGYTAAAGGAESRYEIGFDLLQKVCLLVSDDYHLLFFASAAVTVALIYYAIYRWSKMPLLSIAIFLLGGLFFFSTNAVRQAIAIALFLNAIPYIAKRKPLNYCCLIVLAALFHKSAIILLVLYLTRLIKLNFTTGTLVCIAVAISGGYLVAASLQVGGLVSEQFAVYGHLEKYLEGNFDFLDLGYTVIAYAVFLYVRRGQKKLYRNNDEIRILTNILFVGLLIIIMTGYMFILFRIARYFTPVLIFYIPSLIVQLKTRQQRSMAAWLMVGCFVVVSFVVYGYLEMDHAVPYKTFFFE